MTYKYGEDVLKGLEILRMGIETNVFPDKFVTMLYPTVVRLVGEAGLTALGMVPTDDLPPEIREQREHMRTMLSELFGPR